MSKDSEHTGHDGNKDRGEPAVGEQELDMLFDGEEDAIPAAFRDPPRMPEEARQEEEEDEEEEENQGDTLEGRAVAAARDAISLSEIALEQAGQAQLLRESRTAAPPPARPGRRERAMAILLLVNLVLMGLMALAPGLLGHGGEGRETLRTPPEPTLEPTPEPFPGLVAEPFSEPDRRPDPRVPAPSAGPDPEGNLYEEAMLASRNGHHPRAIRLLKRLLERTPNMSGVERRLVYGQLAYNLLRDGREREAGEYADRIDRMRVHTTLPEDLVRSARRAHRNGRGGDMRRYYARFLLQQDQVGRGMRDVIAEAYLRIGDSYRLEAMAGEKAQAEREAKGR